MKYCHDLPENEQIKYNFGEAGLADFFSDRC